MGLRLKKGLNLKNNIYKKAYEYFKDRLKYVEIKSNRLIAKNLNLLNDCLVEIV
jgi:hypothetical protein